jgi:hypothetical protein
MDASWNSSKLLDTEEDPDEKFSSSGCMMLQTVRRPDGISHHPNGCCLTDERTDIIPRRPDGCKGSNYTILKSA